MQLSQESYRRLSGLWGGYDFRIIRDWHFPTASDLVEKFLDYYTKLRAKSKKPSDQELSKKIKEVKKILYNWAHAKIAKIIQESSLETVQAHIMFKRLHYGDYDTINFGSIGVNWKKKSEIAKELRRYRPWSMDHAIAVFKGRGKLYQHMMAIVSNTRSPTEKKFCTAWWNLTDITDRPMLFPQVMGYTSGKFWLEISDDKMIPVHFDFGFVNVVTRNKILVECDSRRYHSRDRDYQADRERQNIAEKLGWSVRRFTYEDVMSKLDRCFENLKDDLFY